VQITSNFQTEPFPRQEKQFLAVPIPLDFDLVHGFAKGRISVIMPAYNEAHCIEQSIASVKRQFDEFSSDYEIILVDDGSEDGTGKLVQSLAPSRVKVVSYVENRGKGFAVKTGFNHVTGEYTFIMDSDLEVVPTELQEYIDTLKSLDVVIGSKRHPGSIVRTVALRRFLSLGYNVLERLLVGVRVSDTQAGLKGWRSTTLYKVVPLMSVKGYAFDLELLAIASLLGVRVKELPVDIELRGSVGTKQLILMLIDTFRIAYRLRLRRSYQKKLPYFSRAPALIIPWTAIRDSIKSLSHVRRGSP